VSTGSPLLDGVVTVIDMPRITDGVLYGVHLWCMIVNDVL